MSTAITWQGVAYSVPAAGETGWAALQAFLVALGADAATTKVKNQAVRVATTTPVTVSNTTDCVVLTKLAVAGAVAVTLPAGTDGRWFIICDQTGDAATNNITITPNGAETINGSATLVLNQNREGVILVYSATNTRWNVVGRFTAGSPLTNPMTTTGDMIYGASGGTATRFATGSIGKWLRVGASSVPTWGYTGVTAIASANYTITDTDGFDQILVTTGASQRTINLPAVANNTGRVITIKKVDSGAGTILIDTPGSETIDGAAQNEIIAQYGYVTLVSDGSNWNVTAASDYVELVQGSYTALASASGSASDVTGTGAATTASGLYVPPGRWGITLNVAVARSGATMTVSDVTYGIATTSGTTTTGLSVGSSGAYWRPDTTTTPTDWSLLISGYSVAITTATRYYGKFAPSFSAATPTWKSTISARRSR